MPHTVPVWPLSTPANARAHDDPLADRERHVRPELRALGKLAGDDVRLRTMDGVHFANGIGRIESCRRPREGDALLDFLHDVQRVAGSDRLELVVVHKPCLGAKACAQRSCLKTCYSEPERRPRGTRSRRRNSDPSAAGFPQRDRLSVQISVS
jgi:hypothetical protein